MSQRVAYLTFGTNGAGHVARGLAVCDALTQRGAEARLFTPPVDAARLAASHVALETFDESPSTWRDASAARETALARALHRFDPAHVVVDLFWVPWCQLGLDVSVTLLLRSVPPVWLKGPRERAFDASRFDHIWAIERAPGLEPFACSGAVVWRPTGAPTRDALCARLGVAPSDALQLIVRSGVPEDQAQLADAARKQGGTWHELALGASGWLGISPWLATLAASDRVVSAAGYNAFWEAHAFGYADRMIWVPCPRRLDDQAWRAEQGESLDGYNGAHRIAAAACGVEPVDDRRGGR